MNIAICRYLLCLQRLVLRATVHSLEHIQIPNLDLEDTLEVIWSTPHTYFAVEARHSQVRWQLCSSSFMLRQCFSKCGPWSSCIMWELVININYLFPPLTYWIRNSGNGAHQSVFQQTHQLILLHVQVWEPLC